MSRFLSFRSVLAVSISGNFTSLTFDQKVSSSLVSVCAIAFAAVVSRSLSNPSLNLSLSTVDALLGFAMSLDNEDSQYNCFVRCLLRELREMAATKTGGTIILNGECPPWDDVVLDFVSSSSFRLDIPLTDGILRHLFDTSRPGHDGAVLINLFNERTWKFEPKIYSKQNTLPTFPESVHGRGLRHLSAKCLSDVTNALVIVVSEERRTISIFRHGKRHLDLNDTQVTKQLHDIADVQCTLYQSLENSSIMSRILCFEAKRVLKPADGP